MLLGYHAAIHEVNFADEAMGLLGNQEACKDQFALGYLHKCAALNGFTWIVNMSTKYIADPRITRFLCAAPPNAILWDYIESLGQEVDDEYWNQVLTIMNQFLSPEDLERCVSKLNNNGRFASAFNTMLYKLDYVSASTILNTLQGLIRHPSEVGTEADVSVYNVKVVFSKLDALYPDPATMVRLEWAYFQLLNEEDHERPVTYLFQALRDDPGFFSQLITWIGRPEGGDSELEIVGMEPPAIQQRARNADQVIQAWNLLPGQSESREIDHEKLAEWCTMAIAACQEKDRTRLGYNRIGQLFGQLRDGDEHWPQAAICSVMEFYNHDEMKRGFYSGVINGHGVKVNFRSGDSGAALEKAKAEKYRSLAAGIAIEHTVVNSLLLQVAQMYDGYSRQVAEQDAQRE
ncbi:hypothetical protein JN11_00681 [Mucilaginibacter frigoritolerans]|uniref:Uncharacterized protein n=2 Tax=Mucilaginibacter frigoritolerans TaxID=652788 RepID=A0A562UHN5_9SPHI|nr:hypothetical protein JN11_00681 [Mucilaginibacter frigoritolerans]